MTQRYIYGKTILLEGDGAQINAPLTLNANTIENGNLTVNGTTQLAGVTNTGASTFQNGINVTGGNATVTNGITGGSLTVSGATQLATVNVSGVATLQNGANVTNGNVVVSNGITTGGLTVNGGIAMQNTSSVTWNSGTSGTFNAGSTLKMPWNGNLPGGPLNITLSGVQTNLIPISSGSFNAGASAIASPTVNLSYFKMNNLVFGSFQWAQGAATITANVNTIRWNALFTAQMVPLSQSIFACTMLDNGTPNSGQMIINTDGSVVLMRLAQTNFTIAQTVQFYTISFIFASQNS